MRTSRLVSNLIGSHPLRVTGLFLTVAFLAAFAAPVRAQSDAAAKPIHFYRAESADGRVTFFYPSFHLRDARVPRPPMAMLDGVKRLVIEADIEEAKAHPQALTRYILSPTRLDLAKLFTPPVVAGIRSRAACNGVGPMVESLRLSFIAMIIALPCPKPDGGSYEEEVERAAKQRGLAITALETAEEEFAAMAALPDRLFIDEIREVAGDLDAEDELLAQMIVLYDAGDLDALYDLMIKHGMSKPADRKLFLDKVLLERNRRMVDRLAEVLREGDALVVIGALHFPGKDGIVDLLKRRGFKVTALAVEDGALR
jgi:uncharacterized protein YbaP (TraB family)